MQDVRKATVALIVQSCATVLLNEELVVEPLFRADERTFQRISWDRTVQFLSNKDFRVMYRMDLEAFNALLFKLRQRITSNPKYLRKAVFPVIPELRLALTLRYLAGGSVQDLWLMYGVSRREVYRSIWMTIDAINDLPAVISSCMRVHNFCQSAAGNSSTVPPPNHGDGSIFVAGRHISMAPRMDRDGIPIEMLSSCALPATEVQNTSRRSEIVEMMKTMGQLRPVVPRR